MSDNFPCCGDGELDLSSLVDEFCDYMPKRLLVTGLFVSWLRQHFSSADNIVSEFLKDAIWDSDISQTNILIDSVFRYNAIQVEQRPAIYIKPGAWKIVRLGIDDRVMGGPTQITYNNADDPTYMTTYNSFYQGSHTIFCIAGESAEIEILATEVYKEILQYGPIIRKRLNFLKFVVSDIGEPSILEEATEHFVVPIVVSYGGQDVWQICANQCG